MLYSSTWGPQHWANWTDLCQFPALLHWNLNFVICKIGRVAFNPRVDLRSKGDDMYKILGTENIWYLFLINGGSCYDVDDDTDQGSRMMSEHDGPCRLGGHQSVKGRREQKGGQSANFDQLSALFESKWALRPATWVPLSPFKSLPLHPSQIVHPVLSGDRRPPLRYSVVKSHTASTSPPTAQLTPPGSRSNYTALC